MIIFLIGPSRAGKTTLSKKVVGQFLDVGLVNLDDEVDKAERQLREQGVTDLGAGKGGGIAASLSSRRRIANRKSSLTLVLGLCRPMQHSNTLANGYPT